MFARTERSAHTCGPGRLAAAVAILAGAVLVQGLRALPPAWADAALAMIAMLVWMACGHRRCGVWIGGLCLLALAFAWTAWRADLALNARLPHALEKQDILVTGTVTGLPQMQDGATRFEFTIDRANFHGRAVPVRGKVRLAWYASRHRSPPLIAPCSSWQLRLRLKRPHGMVNPGGMDFERTALQQGIIATGYVREDPADRRLAAGACFDRARSRIARAIEAALPADAHAARLLRALSVGDERALDEHDWQVVRATGIAHLIAISGFHVGLAAVFGAWLVRALWWLWPGLGLRLARPLAEAAVALPAAIAYGALAGFGLPTTRTLVMIGVVVGWRLLRRAGGFGEGFSLALIAILLVDPLSVLSAGFWLSFAGVALLAWTLAHDHGWRGYLKEIGVVPLLMTVALLPLTVWFFGQASLVGPLANLVAVPFVSLVIVPLNLVACVLLFAWPWAGQWLLHGCAYLVDGLWWLLTHLAAWPPAMQYLPEASLLAFVLACIGAVWLLAPRGVPARGLGAALLLPLCIPPLSVPTDGAFRATVIDVGQGLSVLVRTRHHALLYDAGARYPSGFDLGAAVVVPALHALGVNHLDELIISHGDNDHAGGATAVLAAFPGTSTEGGEPARGPVPMTQCHAGQQWRWDGVEFRVLSPPTPVTLRDNDAGCVLLVTGRGGRLLLPADTSARIEPAIANAIPAGPPLVLVAPHHGSKSASSVAFLHAVQPQFAVASTGYLNGYHHPAPLIVARYAALGIPLLNTPDTGAVRLVFPIDRAPRILTEERQRHARYWREMPVTAH